ncbi:hypothetical protein TNCV_3651171 [Trichonephila clavipes]|nr:hypothetical protein TNCV_3651171 [Trichonephila clavipes]
MSGHEDKRAPRIDDVKKPGMENPAAHANEMPSAAAHFEIETFDKDTVDTDQLAALIKEKATTELEFATTWVS